VPRWVRSPAHPTSSRARADVSSLPDHLHSGGEQQSVDIERSREPRRVFRCASRSRTCLRGKALQHCAHPVRLTGAPFANLEDNEVIATIEKQRSPLVFSASRPGQNEVFPLPLPSVTLPLTRGRYRTFHGDLLQPSELICSHDTGSDVWLRDHGTLRSLLEADQCFARLARQIASCDLLTNALRHLARTDKRAVRSGSFFVIASSSGAMVVSKAPWGRCRGAAWTSPFLSSFPRVGQETLDVATQDS